MNGVCSLSAASVVLLVSTALLLSGSLLVLLSLRHLNRDNPLKIAFKPWRWTPVWMQGRHFATARGFSLYAFGMEMISSGALVYFVYQVLN